MTNCGGVTTFRKIGAVVEAHNLPLTSHGAHDLAVLLLAAAPNRTYMEVHGFALDGFLAEPMRVVNGFTVASERPGHGLELDIEALEPHRA